MILPDVNVLVYAFRQDVPEHRSAKVWLDNATSGGGRFGLSPLVLAAVVRITTGTRPYAEPSSAADAFAFCNALMSLPNRVIVEPGQHHWEIFARLCLETGTRGRRVTDAWYAALAIEWGCEWISFDRDFARFPGLRWGVPKAPA